MTQPWGDLDAVEFEQRGNLLVPAGSAGQDLVDQSHHKQSGRRSLRRRPADAVQSSDDLRARLTEDRALADVRSEDELARRAQQVDHQVALDELAEHRKTAARARRARARDAKEADALTDLYRRATVSGARARVRTEINGSAEMRALRVAAVRRANLYVGIPALLAFAWWSTTNVQAGAARLLDLRPDTAAWLASWFVEPAIITVVAMIIIVRAVLRASGGDVDWRATAVEWGFLSTSLALAIFGGWHDGGWGAVGGIIAHGLGPLGCATVAFLMGLIDSYVSKAKPWHGVPRIADLDLLSPPPPLGIQEPVRTPINLGKGLPPGNDSDGLPEAVRTLLDAVREAIRRGELPADPTGHAIHKQVMGGKGDRGRAYMVARLVNGKQAGLRAV